MASSATLHYRLYDCKRQAIMEASALGQHAHEAHEASMKPPTAGGDERSSGTTFQQQDESDPEHAPVNTAHASANSGAGGEPSDAGIGGGREDECLGLLAEAFADDLDLLRKDATFTGSSKNIAAMADMMRCLAGGMDSTEQTMLLENAAR